MSGNRNPDYILISNLLRLVEWTRSSRASKHLDDLVHSINPSVHLHARYIQTDISPFIMGFVRPVIVIPAGIYSDSELELVLRHEMIHYLERDSQVKLLLTFLTCIFWLESADICSTKQCE